MKFKLFFAALMMAFFALTTTASATPVETQDIVYQINDDRIDNAEINVEIVIDQTKDAAQCKVNYDITVTTESGNSVHLKGSIEADSCKEAIAALTELTAAFE